MRKFNITFPGISGHIEVTYNQNGELEAVNFRNILISLAGIEKFKQQLPVDLNNLQNAFKNAGIVEADVSVSFDMFWAAYNKKINKTRCVALWDKLHKNNQIAAFLGVKKYDLFLQREKWRNKADPETYLRNYMWENEWR